MLSISIYFFLSLCLSLFLSISQSFHLYMSMSQSFNLYMCLSVNTSVCLSVYLSSYHVKLITIQSGLRQVCQTCHPQHQKPQLLRAPDQIRQSTPSSDYLSICLSVFPLYICPSVYLSFYIV
jgi:hypothetical protein